MAKLELRYDRMMDDAVRGVVAKVLMLAERHGLPGQHHFLVTFRTTFPGVEMGDDLRARYPLDMTIILQNQFWDLKVEEARFSVTLSFNKVPQHLVVPFGAIVQFADPSVKWGIKLEPRLPGLDDAAPAAAKREPGARIIPPERPLSLLERAIRRDSTTVDTVRRDDDDETVPTKVVTLDTFRRK